MRVKTSPYLGCKLPQHGGELFSYTTTLKSKPIVTGSGGELAKLPYIILGNHLSNTEALHLLGRIVRDVRRPLECYVPYDTSMCASLHNALHVNSAPESSTRGFNLDSVFGKTAQDTYPDLDPALFVLPNLPLSVSELTSVTLLEEIQYSIRTQSLLRSLLGLSFSMQRKTSKTLTLNAKVLRVLSLNQHSEVFSKLLSHYGKEIKAALKKAGGKMYFVIGAKLCTDATVETCEEGHRSTAGNMT